VALQARRRLVASSLSIFLTQNLTRQTHAFMHYDFKSVQAQEWRRRASYPLAS